MTTIRVSKRKRYTAIDRDTLNDRRLSYRARGILAYLLAKPNDWTTNADAVAAAATEGREAVRTALTELECVGYLNRSKWRGADGRWHSEWVVHERPPRPISGAGEPTWFPGPQETEEQQLKSDLPSSVENPVDEAVSL